jgi:8-oxo-dGTP diphosphatase
LLGVLCYLKRPGETLMIHRNRKPDDLHLGRWNTLGGKMEPGETPEECAVREVREESGLLASSLRMRGVLTFPEFDGEQDWLVFVLTCTEFSGRLRKSCPEGTLHWVGNDRIPGLNLWEGDRVFMKWLDSEAFWSAKFVYGAGASERLLGGVPPLTLMASRCRVGSYLPLIFLPGLL